MLTIAEIPTRNKLKTTTN